MNRFDAVIKAKRSHLARKKSSFIKTLHWHTNQLKRWPNWLNRSTNCFLSPSILQIWPPAIIICLQTCRYGWLARDFTQIKRSLLKQTCILRSWALTTIKKASIFQKVVRMSVSSWKGTMFKNKCKFSKKNVLLLKPGTFQTTHYIRVESYGAAYSNIYIIWSVLYQI